MFGWGADISVNVYTCMVCAWIYEFPFSGTGAGDYCSYTLLTEMFIVVCDECLLCPFYFMQEYFIPCRFFSVSRIS